MTNNLTPKQKRTIQKAIDDGKPLTGTITISLGVSYQADLIAILEDNPDLFNGNISRLVRDMIQGYKVDWRRENNSQFEEIMRKLDKLGTVTVRDKDTVETTSEVPRPMDGSAGFSEQ